MGLDIHIRVNNYEELHSYEKLHSDDYFNKYGLSRVFCNFILRQYLDGRESELDQIEKITGIDLSPICEMEGYPEEEKLAFFLSIAKSEEEKQEILKKAETDKAKLQGNIDKVLKTVTELIEKLNSIENLPSLLQKTENDYLGNEEYFSEFQVDKGDGYIGNNFGQDLRNFKRFLAFAKERGTTSVWFDYG